jgi:hypothetical protein
MKTYYIPYSVASQNPIAAEPTFCTGQSGFPIVFTTVRYAEDFVNNAKRIGIKLDWGMATELEFPGLEDCSAFEIDPNVVIDAPVYRRRASSISG